MKISLDWLRQYVDVPYSGDELVGRLTMAGIEVEDVRRISAPDKVVACEILGRRPHPKADKLSICTVSTGARTLEVVCGAPNCDTGLLTALALPGTVLRPGPPGVEKEIVVKVAVIRGVESPGMLCSEKELGIGDDGGGIISLPKGIRPGTPLSEIFRPDILLDLEITPNRPDLLSHIGIAREITASSGNPLKLPAAEVAVSGACDHAKSAGTVTIEDLQLCPFYTGRIIRGVKIKESPDWLKRRLESVGLRPINNIVDITNFVLHETGQPLHAFDLKLLSGRKVIIRRARQGEKIVLLDGSEKMLKPDNLVIADADKPVALAGVMGGEFSGVVADTDEILLESAYFKPSNVRATSRELAVSSDSSYRFERGVDPQMVVYASDRAASLILELAGGEAVSDLIAQGAVPPPPPPIQCRYDKIRGIIGAPVQDAEMVRIFKRLSLAVEEGSGRCTVSPPSFRPDLRNEADLAEEVARIHGLSQIPLIPVRAEPGGSIKDDAYAPIENARNQLLALGLNEIYNYSLVSEKDALLDADFAKSDLVEISNPLNLDFAFMRPSLLHHMLQTAAFNIARKNCDISFFEMGTAFCANPKLFPEERLEACIALTGRKFPGRYSDDRTLKFDYFDLKGILEAWLEAMRIRNFRFRKAKNANFADDCCAELLLGGECAAILGRLSTRAMAPFKLKEEVFLAKIQMDRIFAKLPGGAAYSPVSLFPAIVRDLAFVADAGFEHQSFIEYVASLKIRNLEKIEIFDVFTDKSLGEGRKSLAYSITYRDSSRTLTDAEVNAVHDKFRERLKNDLKITLR